MTLMPWSEQLVLGIADIDEQHRCLTDCINELHMELSLTVPNRHNVADILESLVDYAMNHFIAEEKLFHRHRKAESAAHIAEHNGFNSRIMALLDKCQNGEAGAGKEAMTLLKDWLTHHIMVVDKACVPFINASGVH
jgi:hemerythrin